MLAELNAANPQASLPKSKPVAKRARKTTVRMPKVVKEPPIVTTKAKKPSKIVVLHESLPEHEEEVIRQNRGGRKLRLPLRYKL